MQRHNNKMLQNNKMWHSLAIFNCGPWFVLFVECGKSFLQKDDAMKRSIRAQSQVRIKTFGDVYRWLHWDTSIEEYTRIIGTKSASGSELILLNYKPLFQMWLKFISS